MGLGGVFSPLALGVGSDLGFLALFVLAGFFSLFSSSSSVSVLHKKTVIKINQISTNHDIKRILFLLQNQEKSVMKSVIKSVMKSVIKSDISPAPSNERLMLLTNKSQLTSQTATYSMSESATYLSSGFLP